jgi:GNAT superfamily N-acetyltransferase
MSVEPLAPGHHGAAATVLADAFIDDPAWIAAGPRSRRARHGYIRRTGLGSIRAAARWCGPSWCVVEDGEPVAVLTGSAPGLWPPPHLRTILLMAPGALLAGPASLARSLATQRIDDAAHPEYEHFYVWMLAVSPAHQRKGLGRRLMTVALEQAAAAEVPAYLWTGNPANVPYYRSFGFAVIGEATLPGDTPCWFMERPTGNGA